VWTHVHMVVCEMVASQEWRELPDQDRLETFAAALLHDVCKPETRREENGRITNNGHSKMGAVEARKILWKMGFGFAARERVCQMIRVHQVPFWLMERAQWEIDRIVTETSLTVPNKLLAVLAEADAKGRICADQSRMLENVEYFRMAASERGCYDTPFMFSNDHSRLQYFLTPEAKRPDIDLFDTTNCDFTATFMCGLPAMGKSTWAHAQNQPIVSFDDMKEEMDTDNQGQVVQAVRERARGYLRKKKSFVWDSTNISKQFRGLPIQLALDYGARVKIVYVETSAAEMQARNSARTSTRVPDAAIGRMLNRWEVPTSVECHEIVFLTGA
jgi:putative nucleotidyltransferase with HDIG domain